MIIVTGGTGFIGSNLVAGLEQAAPHEPIVLCDWLGNENKWRNISKRLIHSVIAPEQLFDYLNTHASQVKCIFHMGAISSTMETDGEKVYVNNVRLTQDVWEWCAKHHVRLIYASSAATYGDGSHGFDDLEDDAHLAKLHPLNLYAWSKHLFDRWLGLQRRLRPQLSPPQCVGLKFFNVYGPNEYHKGNQRSVIHQIYPLAAKGEAFELFKSHRPDYADGGQLRDFIWVGDVVHVMLWLYKQPQVNGLFNVGTGKARSFADLATAVYRAAGKTPNVRYRDMPEQIRDKYQYFTEARMDKLHAAGYDKPFMSLEDGIAAYVKNYLMKDDPYL